MTLLEWSDNKNPFVSRRDHRINCAHACHCSCHSSGAKHIMACCLVCSVCYGYVIFLEAHLRECHPDHKCSKTA